MVRSLSNNLDVVDYKSTADFLKKTVAVVLLSTRMILWTLMTTLHWEPSELSTSIRDSLPTGLSCHARSPVFRVSREQGHCLTAWVPHIVTSWVGALGWSNSAELGCSQCRWHLRQGTTTNITSLPRASTYHLSWTSITSPSQHQSLRLMVINFLSPKQHAITWIYL